jgi:ATP-dependent DNA ligase
MIDRSRISFRGNYGIATGGAVTDHVLMAVATDFENAVMRKISALAPNDLASRFSGDDPLLLTRKYDGEGALIYFDAEHCFSFSAPAGRVRLGYPALDQLAATLRAAGVQKVLLRGELYLDAAAGADDQRRAGVSEVIRVSFSGSTDEIAALRLALFDIVMLDGRDLRPQQSDYGSTLKQLQDWFGSDEASSVHAVAARQVAERELAAAFEAEVAAGAEGVVVRRLNRAEACKIKPVRTVDAVLIGYVEGDFEGQWGVASLLTALSYQSPDGADGVWLQGFARVGSGLTDAQRIALLDQLRPLKVDAPLAMTDSSGREIHFLKPRHVLELHGEDLIHADGGKPQRSQLFSWSESTGGYEFLGLNACPRLSFARFSQLREDKNWRDGGARIEQIGVSGDRPRLQTRDEETKLLRREVYAKGEMLRKLVVLRKGGDNAYPYLVYWTDYSARRAEPLKVSVDLAATSERAEAIAAKLLAANLPKGWERLPDEGAGAEA